MSFVQVKKSFGRPLEADGYRRSGWSWRRQHSEVVVGCDLQKSQYSDDLYVNLGFWLLRLAPLPPRLPDHKFHARTRAESVLPSGVGTQLEALVSRRDPLDVAIAVEIDALVQRALLPLMNDAGTIDGLSRVISIAPNRWLIFPEARQALAER